jgi:hypothetical protein
MEARMDDRPSEVEYDNPSKFNLNDQEAYNRLPTELRHEIDVWVGGMTVDDRFKPYLAMLFCSFIFQRLSLDTLERLISEVEAPSDALERHRMEALRFLFLLLRDEARQKIPPKYLIDSVKAASSAIIKELRRLDQDTPTRPTLDIDFEEGPLREYGEALNRCGSVVLFKGERVAAEAALTLVVCELGKRHVPIYLFGSNSSFDRALLRQGFSNVEPIVKWRGAGIDTAWLRRLMADRRTAGVTVISRFRGLFRGGKQPPDKRTAYDIARLRPVLCAAQTSIVGCVDSDSAVCDLPERHVHVYPVGIERPLDIAAAGEGPPRQRLHVNGQYFDLPEGFIRDSDAEIVTADS